MASTEGVLLFSLLIFFVSLNVALSGNCKGAVPLDSYSFDKIITKFEASVIKFDVAYPYGDKHEEFCKVSESVRDVSDLLIGEIGIKDYGEKENGDLGERFKVDKEDYPVIKLFTKGGSPKTFTGDFKSEDILNYIRLNTKVYVGLPGCLEEFDRLALEFIEAKSEDSKRKILRKTEDAWDTATGSSNQKSAEVYVKTMRKILEKKDFVTSEFKRLDNILKGKISKDKSKEMLVRLNILHSFRAPDTKDEL